MDSESICQVSRWAESTKQAFSPNGVYGQSEYKKQLCLLNFNTLLSFLPSGRLSQPQKRDLGILPIDLDKGF
jgi:hypothetical protein